MCQALCIDCLIKFPQQAYKLGFNFFPPNKDGENKPKNLSAGKRCFLNSNSDLNFRCLGSNWILWDSGDRNSKEFVKPFNTGTCKDRAGSKAAALGDINNPGIHVDTAAKAL